MRILFFIPILFFSLFISCTGSKSSEDEAEIANFKEIIVQKEDSLSQLQKENKQIPREKYFELIQSLMNRQFLLCGECGLPRHENE